MVAPTQLVSWKMSFIVDNWRTKITRVNRWWPVSSTVLSSHTGTAGCWPHCSSRRPSQKMFMAMWSIGQMSHEDNLEGSRIGAKWRKMNCHGILITIYLKGLCVSLSCSPLSHLLFDPSASETLTALIEDAHIIHGFKTFPKNQERQEQWSAEQSSSSYLMSEESDRARLWSVAEITQASIKYWWGPDQSRANTRYCYYLTKYDTRHKHTPS